MESKLSQKPIFESRVTTIRTTTAPGSQGIWDVDFQDDNGKHTNCNYAAVFNSTILCCLREIDTSLAGLSYATKQAMHSLGYGPSAKVGIKFKSPWWMNHSLQGKVIQGGLGHSDLIIHTCVYPSYNLNNPSDQPAVLLCSYTWQQDAQCIGALMSGAPDSNHAQQLADELPLKDLLIRELARLHHSPDTPQSYQNVYNLIETNYLDHYAHDWDHDPNTIGALAFFHPQQFSEMWGRLIQPSGNFFIVGEAASPHHAWVVGALESAVHGVHTWLAENPDIQGAIEAKQILEQTDPNNHFVGLPPYMDPNMSNWHSFLGMIRSDEHAQWMQQNTG